MSNKYDLICLFTGAITSAFFIDTFEKTISTCIAMAIATILSFFIRRLLWFRFKELFKNKIKQKKEENGNME